MEFFTKYNLTWSKALKTGGFILAALIVLAFVFSLVGSSFTSVFQRSGSDNVYSGVAQKGLSGLSVEDSAFYGERGFYPSPPYNGGFTSGDDAEEFEVTDYSATVETRDLEKDCAVIADLKPLEYVIFESANESDRGCNYSFKVRHQNVPEILAVIDGLDPKELSENVYTIKRQIENVTSEVEILENKLASINGTLENAIKAYDDITALATRIQDIESLAKIIDSKLGIIERLTEAKLNVVAQLERLNKAKAEQLDRLEYTYFYVNIYENKFVDGEVLKDSWKASIKQFVSNVNRAAQGVTVNLIGFLFLLLQYVVYLLILVVIAKYGWKFVKHIWEK